jgi:hypothetical protein
MFRSTSAPRLVDTDTTMTLISDPDSPLVLAELRYFTNEPYSVRLTLTLAESPAVEWVFARDLLLQGVRLPAGQGDIQIYPTSEGVVVELHSPDGDARLLAGSEALVGFADAVEAAVPVGTEDRYFSLDAELADLLILTGQDTAGH